MRANKGSGPTRMILRYADSQPGGIIRWHEARNEYLKASSAARADESRGARNYHMGIKRIFDRHFTKVEGTDGYYVRTCTIGNYDDAFDLASGELTRMSP